MSTHPLWMKDPIVANIDSRKLEFLSGLSIQNAGQNQKEVLAQMMTAMRQAKAQNVSFSSNEIASIVTAIKKHSSSEELEKIDQIMKRMPH